MANTDTLVIIIKQVVIKNSFPQVLKDDEYQEHIVSKIFTRINNKQHTKLRGIDEEKVRMSINALYVEGATEKLRHILKSHKISSFFFIENTLHKLFCRPKD